MDPLSIVVQTLDSAWTVPVGDSLQILVKNGLLLQILTIEIVQFAKCNVQNATVLLRITRNNKETQNRCR